MFDMAAFYPSLQPPSADDISANAETWCARRGIECAMSCTPDPLNDHSDCASRRLHERPDVSHGPAIRRFVWLIWHIWPDRYRQRSHLREMEPHRLDDIGISRAEAKREGRKPFWL
jgi:uncharacterized protein YjiS (DUF1127 family)